MANTKISGLTAATTPLAGTEVLPIVQGSSTVKVANNDLRPKQIQSNATTGVLQVAGPSAGNTRVMTTPDANFTVARTDAGQTFTGNQQINGTLGVKSSGGIVTVETTTARGSGSNYVNLKDPSGDKGYVGYISGANDNLYLWNVVNSSVVIGVNNSTTWTFDTSQNLVPATAAKGIDFSANTPLAGKTSTLLNWYEEGTWTPNQGGGLTLVGAFSSTGRYTRIGRQVSISGTVTGATSVAVTAAGVITSNLPFTVVTAGHGDATNVAVNASAAIICTSTNVTSASAIAATATITFSATYFV